MAEPDTSGRRSFLGAASGIAMGGGLLAGYGTFFAYAGRFLYPARDTRTAWMYLATLDEMRVGDSKTFRTPGGAAVVVARRGSKGTADDFLALSSTCPHLGCQVHFEPQNERFFCPCHNGIFDRTGKGIGGPPGDAGQSLPQYPLRIERGLLYIEVPLEQVARAPARDGHDPCLGGRA